MKEYIIKSKIGRTARIAFLYANDNGGGWETFEQAIKHSSDIGVAYSPFIASMTLNSWKCLDFGEFKTTALSAAEKKTIEQNFFEEIKREEGWERIN